MKPGDILKVTAHRPDAMPDRPWAATQQWRSVIFLHWKIAPELLIPHIPQHPSVVLDTFNGSAWVSLVGFHVCGARLRYLPPIPLLSSFHELNLRTYVKEHDHSGVVFLNIGASKLLPVLLNRAVGLPYKLARLRAFKDSFFYRSKGNNSALDISWLTERRPLAKQLLDVWLTDRYYSVQQVGKRVCHYPIHHPPWPLQSVSLQKAEGIYKWKNIELQMKNVELAHYAPGVEALLWTPRKISVE